jgi:hypothetical protein
MLQQMANQNPEVLQLLGNPKVMQMLSGAKSFLKTHIL